MQLESKRLLLREFVADDWPAVLTYQSDPRFLRYYHWTERTERDVRAFVQMFLDQQQAQPRTKFQLALMLKSQGRLIGNCGIRINNPEQREADIGYELEPQSWGQGLATEAAGRLLEFGFTKLHLLRVTARCVAKNIGSARVLEKIGMTQTDYLRQKEYIKGEWHDHLHYAIHASEWQALHRQTETASTD